MMFKGYSISFCNIKQTWSYTLLSSIMFFIITSMLVLDSLIEEWWIIVGMTLLPVITGLFYPSPLQSIGDVINQ